MKKKLISIGLGLAVAGSVMATTVTHFTYNMLSGTYLCITNNSTFTETTTNQPYYSYTTGTNVLIGATNTATGALYANPLIDAMLVPDINADVNPNLAVQIIIGYTNNLFLSAVQSPVLLNTQWTNPAPAVASSSGATNVLTITLVPIASGQFGVADTTGRSLSWSVTANGLTPVVTSTNLPVAFLQGASGMRATIAVATATGSTGVIVNALNLTGWKP